LGALGMKTRVIERDGVRRLLLLRLRLLLFLSRMEQVTQTLSVFFRKMILVAKIQVIAEPFDIGRLRRIRHPLGAHIRLKLGP